jgi:hypothetical protein
VYCYFGGKFYPIMHGLYCGVIYMVLHMVILGLLRVEIIVGVITGLICAILLGYGCFRWKQYQAFFLGIQLG